jgi:hypothetical protein
MLADVAIRFIPHRLQFSQRAARKYLLIGKALV